MVIYTNQKHNSKKRRSDHFTRKFFQPILKGMLAMTVFAFMMVILTYRYPAFMKSILTFHY